MLKDEEIVNRQYAVHGAKVEIVKSFILSCNEIEMIKNLYDTENVKFPSIQEFCEFSEIKLTANHSSLLYIIGIPTIMAMKEPQIVFSKTRIEETLNPGIDQRNEPVREYCGRHRHSTPTNRYRIVRILFTHYRFHASTWTLDLEKEK
uniref:Uncharacterized protein n=1 Tax=Glossina austeni TaxID=7395 RepID=A0A1A9VN61_GLOAU